MNVVAPLRHAAFAALLVLPALTLSAAAAEGPGWGPGHAMMWGGPTRNWFGWGSSEHFCGQEGERNIERFSALIERQVKITEAQKPALETLKGTFQSAMTQLDSLCEKPHTGRWSPMERLSVAEAHLNAMLNAIKSIRGPLEALYAGLDDKQKKAFDELRPDWRMQLPWGK
jgi:hypothetical protein